MQFLDILKQYGASGALIVILVFFGNKYMTKIQNIETQLSKIQIEIIQLQAQLVPADTIKMYAKELVQQHQKIYHNIGK